MKINAAAEDGFVVDGVRFISDMTQSNIRRKSDDTAFTIVKSQPYFDFYESVLDKAPKDIFEVGFFEGGSSVFLDCYFKPESLTCVDIRKAEIAPVSNYIERHKRADAFRMVYGQSQGDTEGLSALVAEHHPSGLDMVIDDASHQYHLTKETFSALFPALRPGGLYVVEDYGWAHFDTYQSPDHPWFTHPSMINLLFELSMAMVKPNGAIASIQVLPGLFVVERGALAIPTPFDPSENYLARGRTLELI